MASSPDPPLEPVTYVAKVPVGECVLCLLRLGLERDCTVSENQGVCSR